MVGKPSDATHITLRLIFYQNFTSMVDSYILLAKQGFLLLYIVLTTINPYQAAWLHRISRIVYVTSLYIIQYI